MESIESLVENKPSHYTISTTRLGCLGSQEVDKLVFSALTRYAWIISLMIRRLQSAPRLGIEWETSQYLS